MMASSSLESLHTSGDTSSNEDTNGATGGDNSGNAVEGIVSPPSNDNASPQGM